MQRVRTFTLRLLFWGIGVAVPTSACNSNVVFKVKDTSAAGLGHVCNAAHPGDEGLKPDCHPLTDDTAGDEKAPTIVMDASTCQGRIHEIFFRDVDTSSPTAHVVCAAPEGVGGSFGTN